MNQKGFPTAGVMKEIQAVGLHFVYLLFFTESKLVFHCTCTCTIHAYYPGKHLYFEF